MPAPACVAVRIENETHVAARHPTGAIVADDERQLGDARRQFDGGGGGGGGVKSNKADDDFNPRA